MNFEFAEMINPYLEKFDFSNALKIGEDELNKLPVTAFHNIVGNSLISQVDELATWIEQFYDLTALNTTIKTIYFEMNEFDINTDLWFIDGYAFSKDGGLDYEDMDWLTDFDTDSQTETETVFAIAGYEKLQVAFKKIKLKNEDLQNARDWCEQIIIARFMELMRSAHLTAKERNLNWSKVPIYFTEHEYDFVLKSEV